MVGWLGGRGSGAFRERRWTARYRPRGDAFVRIGGRDTPLLNWSRAGFLAGPYHGGVVPLQRVRVEVVIRDIQDPTPGLRFEAPARIVRVDTRGIAGVWIGTDRYRLRDIDAYIRAKGDTLRR